MTLHHFDLRGRVRVQFLTYVDISERKVSTILPTANGLRGVFTVKQRVST